MEARRRPDDVQRFIHLCDEQTRALLTALRATTSIALVGAREIVYRGALGYTAHGPSARFVHLAPGKGYVSVVFRSAALLPDPKGLLEGSGKQTRHVKVRTIGMALSEPLQELLVASRRAALGR